MIQDNSNPRSKAIPPAAVSPQLENGFTRIANEILEALARVKLSPHESCIVWFVLRKTYGWRKKSDWISGSQMRAGLGGVDRRHIFRALKRLCDKNMLVICRDDARKPKYSFQKDYSKWCVSSNQMTGMKVSSLRMTRVIRTDDAVSSVRAHTKETLTKETIQKKRGGAKARPSQLLNKKKLDDLPSYVDPDVFANFVEMRKVIRKPLTDKSFDLLLEELAELHDEGEDVNACLKRSIVRSYPGVYRIPPDEKPAEVDRCWQPFKPSEPVKPPADEIAASPAEPLNLVALMQASSTTSSQPAPVGPPEPEHPSFRRYLEEVAKPQWAARK